MAHPVYDWLVFDNPVFGTIFNLFQPGEQWHPEGWSTADDGRSAKPLAGVTLMKLVHACCLVFHGMIAGAYAHECLLAPADPHKHIVTGAYFALTIAQAVLVYLLFKDGPKRGAKLLP